MLDSESLHYIWHQFDSGSHRRWWFIGHHKCEASAVGEHFAVSIQRINSSGHLELCNQTMATDSQSIVANVCVKSSGWTSIRHHVEYCIEILHFYYRVISCALFIIPSHYIWLHYLSPVGDRLFPQYQFGCMAVSVSCIIEQIAEVPSFITQVNCKLKLRVLLDCIHLTVRSIIFIYLVKSDPANAIVAFGIAQVISSIVFTSGSYGYYYTTIGKTKEDGQTIILKRFVDMFPFFRNEVNKCNRRIIPIIVLTSYFTWIFDRAQYLTQTLKHWLLHSSSRECSSKYSLKVRNTSCRWRMCWAFKNRRFTTL